LYVFAVSEKSDLRNKFLILDNHLPNAVYLRGQGCEDPSLLLETKRGLREKKFWETLFLAM